MLYANLSPSNSMNSLQVVSTAPAYDYSNYSYASEKLPMQVNVNAVQVNPSNEPKVLQEHVQVQQHQHAPVEVQPTFPTAPVVHKQVEQPQSTQQVQAQPQPVPAPVYQPQTTPVYQPQTTPSQPQTTSTTTEPDAPLLHPVALLKSMFGRNEYGRVLMQNQVDNMSFHRPSKDAVEAYDLTVVQAIRYNDMDKLRAMLHEGKSFNACNRFGESLIHMVCRRGNIPMATFLIKEACVDVDVRDDFGRTALHDACWTSKPNVAMMDLLINNVSPDMLLTEDVRGHTPFDYSRKEHYKVWTDYLSSKEDDLQRRITTYGMIRG